MAAEKSISVDFPIKCRGRDQHSQHVLTQPVDATVTMYQPPGVDTVIYNRVTCPFIAGGHGQRCKASHPEHDKVGEGVFCPFAQELHNS